jgi:hypothetical protein
MTHNPIPDFDLDLVHRNAPERFAEKKFLKGGLPLYRVFSVASLRARITSSREIMPTNSRSEYRGEPC